MITGKINASKIDKSGMFEGKNGLYFDITLLENKDGPDQWGNSGMIVQDLGKDRRLAGEKGPIIGNWKHVGGSSSKPAGEARRTPPPHPGRPVRRPAQPCPRLRN